MMISFDNGEEKLFADFLYIKNTEVVKSRFINAEIRVVGVADQGIPIVSVKGHSGLFAIDYLDHYVIVQIADGVDSLYKFLNEVEKLWAFSSSSINLDIQEDKIIQAIALAEDFKKENPNSDFGFWEIECFPGLNLGFDQIN